MELISIIFKIIFCIYDIITLPVYIVLQRPWINWSNANKIRAKQISPGDPYSPWVSLTTPAKHAIDDCLTVNEAIKKSIDLYGRDNQCLGYREVIRQEIEYSVGKPITKYVLSDYKWITYGELDQRIDIIGKGLLLKGIAPGDKVMIFAHTSLDWFICGQSILRIGATVTTLYTSANNEGIIHVINETEVTHIFTSHQLLMKLVRLKDKIPKMSTIIYFNTNHKKENEIIDEKMAIDIIPLSDLEEMAHLLPQVDQLGFESPKEDDIALLIYTSGNQYFAQLKCHKLYIKGSTGVPKGVILTHKNIMNGVAGFSGVMDQIDILTSNRIYIAYLPLAHVFEYVFEMSVFLRGTKIGYSSPFTLTDSGTAIRKQDKGDATLLKPTVMIGVPLILDRICKGIYDEINEKGLIARKLFDFLVDYKAFWNKKGFDTPLMNRIFCNRFRDIIGGQICFMVSGGAPLSPRTHKIIKTCLNLKLIQGYGTTETSANGFVMDMFDSSFGQTGAPILGAHVKLYDWKEGDYKVTDKPNSRGEIVIGSKAVSVGYFKLKTENEEAFYTDSEGQRWFLTGDIGEVFPNGTFKIIDRKKDLIKLKFGEYVSLGKIESELKSNEFVDNICVFGHLYDSYLVALIIPNQLSVLRLAKSLEVNYNSIYDLYENQRIIHCITNQIQRHGKSAQLSKYEIPQKIMLCSEEWSPDNGLLTSAMKNKRKNIINKHKKQIDLMYENNNNYE